VNQSISKSRELVLRYDAEFCEDTGCCNSCMMYSNYTATATDEYIGVNSTSLVTVTLPIGITGRQYIIKEERGNGTGKVNVQGTGAETIDGSPFKQLTANASLTVVFRAGQWRII
jgi:hypothetical protein